jgi:hypothetical protein
MITVMAVCDHPYLHVFSPCGKKNPRAPFINTNGNFITEVYDMCISCGCGMPNDKHNNPDLITMDDLQRAAKAANMKADDAAKNIADSVGLNCNK